MMPRIDIRMGQRFAKLVTASEAGIDARGDWTCWLALACIPFRSKTDDPEELLAALMERWPCRGRRDSASR